MVLGTRPSGAAADLRLERAITDAYRRNVDAPPALREAAILEAMWPAMLEPRRPGERFVGRASWPLVGFSPEPGGFGLYCRFADLEARGTDEARDIAACWRGKTTSERTRAAYPPDLAALLPSDAWTSEPGAAFPLYRLGGLTLDFHRLFERGLGGLAHDVRESRATGPFRDGLLRVIGVVQRTVAESGAKCPTTRPPETLEEAIQLLWLVTLVAGVWNHGRLDDLLGPFLVHDLETETIDEDEALDLVVEFWNLIADFDNQYNNRVVLGGVGRRNPAAADRFALLAIDATRRVRRNQPQLSLRFHAGQDPRLMARALDALGEGCTFPILYNDDVNVPAVEEAFGVSRTEAEQYFPYGCGETVLWHRSIGTPSGVVNLPICLLEALEQPGVDSIDDLWDAYATRVEELTLACARQQKLEYDVAACEGAFLLPSLLMDGCLERGRPLLEGGIRHLGGTYETYGNTNVANAFAALAHTGVSLSGMREALRADFQGFDSLHRALLEAPKYGNDDKRADSWAVRVHEHVCHATRDCAARVGLDSYLVVVINNWANVIFGRVTGATPDGRRSGEPFANGNNPSPGTDVNGPTAFLNSLVKLTPRIHAGAVQNMKFAPEWFGSARPKAEALLAAYWASGGAQAMITVVSAGDLEAAMREPEKWGHLMVRVGGFSARFIDLPHDAQLEILRRTLHG